MNAKTKNGTTPTHAKLMWKPRRGLTAREPPAAIGAVEPVTERSLPRSALLDRRADGGRPTLGDHVGGLRDLVEGRELRAGGVRQLGLGGRVDGAGLDHGVVADRVAVALQPQVLALVAVQELHPQLRRVRMRREGADCLHVHATEAAALRDDDLDRRVAGEGVLVREAVVRPRDADRRLAVG